eukprot:CAMPEP_0182857940 /NCGR_PEP_ID=MMETSP0034_2-20130328/3352_1 /TAXON_ID=156128 /ORGANISM="Nephroselmis pyriformis, Strain CCMP717" /LENGTH=672 /DNA_ID=CAMNT_0024989257 /DNA_START=88 /DNA_END=2103 /DNA_ORIENTATION=+
MARPYMPGRGALISAALFLSCTATLELALSSSLPSSGDSGRAGRALLESHEIAQCDTISFAGCPDHLQDPDLQLAAMRELPSDSGIGSGSGGSAPSEWTCSASFYNANDGCDCNCGAQDPDCGKPGNDKVFNCSPEEQYCMGGICVSATPAPTPLSCSEDIMSICSAPSCAAAYQAYVTCQRNIQNDINCGKPDPFIFYECSRCGVAVDGLEEPEDVPLSTLLALRAFKAAITGDPYGALDTWNEETPVCQWWGVSCNECGDDVTGLYLYGNDLSGTIAPAIGNLISLEWLELFYNDLSGTIPPAIGNLTSLVYLGLEGNDLSGTIPPAIGNLTSLVELWVYDNDLSGTIPPAIGNLTSLLYLTLYDNDLSGTIPPAIGNLTSLVDLTLNGNDLSGTIPPAIGNLTSLVQLYLDGNNLSGTIPPAIGNLTSLVALFLAGNDLSGTIPPAIGNLTSLERLGLLDNDLSGTIPPAIGNLTSLERLFLNGNDLSGTIPPAIGNLTSLVALFLNGNDLSGTIPPAIGNLTSLESLTLNGNDLSGTIPPAIGNLTSLRLNLDLSLNQLVGTLPKELARLPRHPTINLDFNELEGQVPSAFFDATSPTVSVWYNDLKCSNWEVLQEVNIVGVPTCGARAVDMKRMDAGNVQLNCQGQEENGMRTIINSEGVSDTTAFL